MRGWLARRLARALVLRGGCRRELDIASGAWQYVWGHPAALDAPAPAHEGTLFRSWYPPTLLKNEILPSPRSALRRVEGEEKKREARLALANDVLDEQRGQSFCSIQILCKKSSGWWLALAGLGLTWGGIYGIARTNDSCFSAP